MGKLLMVPEQSGGNVSAAAIQEQLERILGWPAFQNSRRYPRFLKYIVNKAIAGSAEEIKERVIGMAVFDRPADYEPATDPVVRLVAGEIRKRLAQYYIQPEHEQELRIGIPPGSYVPVFHWPQSPAERAAAEEAAHTVPEQTAGAEAAPSAVPAPASGVGRLRWIGAGHRNFSLFLLGVALLVLLVGVPGGTFWWMQLRPHRLLNAFWGPLVGTGPSTLICIGDWTNIAPALHDALNRPPEETEYVGPYDLGALGRLVGMLGRKDRQFSLLLANDVTLTDLRSEPGILIGSTNNRWTPTVLAGARYQFRMDPAKNTNILVDTQNPSTRFWTGPLHSGGQPETGTQDIGLISRTLSSATGQVEVVVAGVGRCGTTAASEFITNPEYFKQIAGQVPRNWASRNIQMVVSTNVINGRSGPPHLIAVDVR